MLNKKKEEDISNPSKASNVPAKCYGVKNIINKLFYNSQLFKTCTGTCIDLMVCNMFST